MEEEERGGMDETGSGQDQAVDMLVQAVEMFEAGDYHRAALLCRQGRENAGPDAVKEAKGLEARLNTDRVAVWVGIGLALLLLVVWIVAGSR